MARSIGFAAAALGLATGVLAQYGPHEVPQPEAAPPPRRDAGALVERTARVRSVDEASGRLVLETPDGPLTLWFPAEALATVRSGDDVWVRVALLPEPESTTTKGAGSFGTEPEVGSPRARPPARP
jgi:hypothetical protein